MATPTAVPILEKSADSREAPRSTEVVQNKKTEEQVARLQARLRAIGMDPDA